MCLSRCCWFFPCRCRLLGLCVIDSSDLTACCAFAELFQPSLRSSSLQGGCAIYPLPPRGIFYQSLHHGYPQLPPVLTGNSFSFATLHSADTPVFLSIADPKCGRQVPAALPGSLPGPASPLLGRKLLGGFLYYCIFSLDFGTFPSLEYFAPFALVLAICAIQLPILSR